MEEGQVAEDGTKQVARVNHDIQLNRGVQGKPARTIDSSKVFETGRIRNFE